MLERLGASPLMACRCRAYNSNRSRFCPKKEKPATEEEQQQQQRRRRTTTRETKLGICEWQEWSKGTVMSIDTNIHLTEGMESGSGIHCFISIVFCRKVLCNKLLLLLLLFVRSELLVGTCSEPMLLVLLLPELLILSVVVVVVKEVVVATDSTPSLEQLGVVPRLILKCFTTNNGNRCNDTDDVKMMHYKRLRRIPSHINEFIYSTNECMYRYHSKSWCVTYMSSPVT
jgi:hypothetical protein